MSHYDIHYDDSLGSSESRRAICDAIRYNRRAVKAFLSHARQGEITSLGQATLLLALAGIQGYPVRALWSYVSVEEEQFEDVNMAEGEAEW
jgi:hypothetical protein